MGEPPFRLIAAAAQDQLGTISPQERRQCHGLGQTLAAHHPGGAPDRVQGGIGIDTRSIRRPARQPSKRRRRADPAQEQPGTREGEDGPDVEA